MDTPRTSYAKSGDVHVAYQVLGDGPVDLVYVQGAFTHIGVMWELPAFSTVLPTAEFVFPTDLVRQTGNGAFRPCPGRNPR